MGILPLSAVIPTMDRADVLRRTLESLAQQSVLPAEIIVIDGSSDDGSKRVLNDWAHCRKGCVVVWEKAKVLGAAAQRNQGVGIATQPFVWFFDDDIIFEPDCLVRLWQSIKSDLSIAGANAMITNQKYSRPGALSRALFRTLHGKSETSYAGKCIGPAFNLLPEDNDDLPEVVPVEWLNTTCTIYRRNVLKTSPFSDHFTGYSLLEDLALSLQVAKNWKLVNARTARIFHDTQPGNHKNNLATVSKMWLVNRHHVMTHILGKHAVIDYLKLMLLETFGVVTPLVSPRAWKALPNVLRGKVTGVWTIVTQGTASDVAVSQASEQATAKD